LLYGSQQDYDALTGKAVPGKPTWAPADFAAMGRFMTEFSAGGPGLLRGRGPAGDQPPAAAPPASPRHPPGR